MSHLSVYNEDQPATPIVDTDEVERIREELASAGIRLERWHAGSDLPDNADSETIIAAYREPR
jgi:1,2-dihydroxy-3-keto-5-methylthiopentene dioxygenase